MNIDAFIKAFLKSCKYESYKSICADVLMGSRSYSLNSLPGYDESDYLPVNIRDSVRKYTRDKDNAVELYKGFVRFLREKGVMVQVEFPPVSISSSFDRQLFIAKYLQSPNAHISDLEDILWVSPRTIEDDLKSLRGEENPISVGGKRFCIPNMERNRGTVRFASTAHPLFLTENLTQVIVTLKGLKTMSENPLYAGYAVETAANIWDQLSPYAKERIHFVLTDLMPEELSWYETLSQKGQDSFYTEEACSRVQNYGAGVVMDCMKNEKTFCVEYAEDNRTVFYADCKFVSGTYRDGRIEVECSCGRKVLVFDRVIRSAYSAEELLSD